MGRVGPSLECGGGVAVSMVVSALSFSEDEAKMSLMRLGMAEDFAMVMAGVLKYCAWRRVTES